MVTKGQLRGVAKVQQPSGLVFSDCRILQSERGCWVTPPSKPLIDRDGKRMRDGNGKTRYSSIIELASGEISDSPVPDDSPYVDLAAAISGTLDTAQMWWDHKHRGGAR